MRIYYGIEDAAKELSCSVVSVGSFDGVHAGHRTLISRMNEYRDELNRGGCDASSVVVTFMPHPRQVLGSGVSLLNTVEEKALLMEECGLDAIVVLRFDEDLRSMHSSEFFDMLCGRIGMKVLVGGYDHRFGCDGARGEQALTALGERYGVVTEVMPEYEVAGAHVSSTEVRKAMLQGDMTSLQP